MKLKRIYYVTLSLLLGIFLTFSVTTSAYAGNSVNNFTNHNNDNHNNDNHNNDNHNNDNHNNDNHNDHHEDDSCSNHPDQSKCHVSVPEFGLATQAVALIGSVGTIFFVRKRG